MPLISMSPKIQLRKSPFWTISISLSVTVLIMGFGGLEGPSRRSWCWRAIVFDLASAAAVLSCNGLSEYFSCFFPVLCLPIVIVDSVRVNSRLFPSFVANSISARCNTACLFVFLSIAKKRISVSFWQQKKRLKTKTTQEKTMQERRATPLLARDSIRHYLPQRCNHECRGSELLKMGSGELGSDRLKVSQSILPNPQPINRRRGTPGTLGAEGGYTFPDLQQSSARLLLSIAGMPCCN